jgi:hypothetical protein
VIGSPDDEVVWYLPYVPGDAPSYASLREAQLHPPEPVPPRARLRLTEDQLRALESLDMGEAFGPLWRSLTTEVRASWAERDELRRRLS